jgi:hypothetical protein
VNAALTAAGLQTWFDETEMRGDIVDKMTSGIEDSHVIVAFITRTTSPRWRARVRTG